MRLRRIVAEEVGGERPGSAKEAGGAGCQAFEGEREGSLDLGFRARQGHRSGTLLNYGHQRVSGMGATGAPWSWIFPATLRQSDRWFKDRSVR